MSVTRMSRLFVRTLREPPAGAESASHALLVRAGYVRRLAPGIYSWLPLGWRVVRRVERVVREEMDAIGAQEVHLPALVPAEMFEASGRLADYGDLLFRLSDRREVAFLLGPTHEEVFTALVKGEYASWRDYPVILYQIQTKYRDEARPRAGVLRAREFLMKDSYSFDVSDAGLAGSYELHRRAYQRIFERLGLDYRIVSAVSGAMGGSASEEFLAPTPAGEDTFVECTGCGYAANAEAVELAVPPAVDPAAAPPLEVVDTPDTPTIDTLVARLRALRPDREWTGADTLKNVVLLTREPAGARRLLVVGVPGDREVDLKRLAGQLDPVTVEPASAEDIATVPGLVTGYIGPQVLAGLGVRYLVDPLVAEGSAWVTGANERGRHALSVVRGRDFEPDGQIGAVLVRDGDRCARCGQGLRIATGIECGHIFQLGRKFADIAALDAAGPDGTPLRVTMGSYGIGVTRVVAALAEQHHDDRGLCWPASVAPFDVHLVVAGRPGSPAPQAAETLAAQLAALDLRVLLDDREVSPGIKFADAELIGVPLVVVVGRGVAAGTVELRERAAATTEDVELALAASVVSRRVAAAPATGEPR